MCRYGIPQVQISAYNSRANGVVERGHFTIREALLKACQGHIERWPDYVHHAFFTDRITVSQVTGYSAYYLLYGVHPVLPFDLTEATFMMENYRVGMSTAELLALRIRQLQKRPEDIARAAASLKKAHLRSKEVFERIFAKRLRTELYQPGELVLVRNSMEDKSVGGKAQPRYLGPFEVIRRTQNGAYVLRELDGTPMRKSTAAFRLYPYVQLGDPRLEALAQELNELEARGLSTDEEWEALDPDDEQDSDFIPSTSGSSDIVSTPEWSDSD